MESSAALRSFHFSVGTVSHMRSLQERPGIVSVQNGSWAMSGKMDTRGFTICRTIISSPIWRNETLVSCVKTSEASVVAKTDDMEMKEKTTRRTTSFPNGFEALVLQVCDETEIAELKMKVGDFEMHVKRNVGATNAPMLNISPATPPPIPTKPMDESAPVAPPPSPPKSSPEKVSPFRNTSSQNSPKLAALEASGVGGYVKVASPTVGSFRRNRTIKGKKQPPICKEGDVIKEGQVIGYVDQFGTELPVKSDVAGEVLKLLFDDGDAVGYGDYLIAVLPSFHGIE
ncbi:Biotin/lipoyl attachment domain-containing protein isoform 1 [Tripterygium wilfordii]|uniref:Biotin/lipoyl attachment domain-containing protein isoform 1 n=1 Tax=Tripterygium wilfordii TaxID=458696 RepID=A0A7J7CR14_TRIWF|nr:biotin carboxyl carrier protein of acetyl-CoA carboxylase-like [Tripterygium wilfordii]KAF5736530.1 Biotin/lipoyl attachment domain-containing protein isoform 1 [Tripterygium wilfordii]